MGEKPKVISHLRVGEEEEEEELLGLGRNRSCGSARRGAGQIQGIRKDSKISYKLSVLCCMKFPTRTLKLVGHTHQRHPSCQNRFTKNMLHYRTVTVKGMMNK